MSKDRFDSESIVFSGIVRRMGLFERIKYLFKPKIRDFYFSVMIHEIEGEKLAHLSDVAGDVDHITVLSYRSDNE